MSLTFSDFAIADTLKQGLIDLEFSTPTDVQAAAIPLALEGKDLLVSSQTGSGKTIAFLLPSINHLATNEQPPMSVRLKSLPSPSVLVICPTRELAQQVSQDAINLVRHVRGVRIASIMGGMPFGKQIAQLKGAQVVVATPGRLLDLVNRRQLSLADVRTMILDEADRMLDLGFSEDLEAISELAADRQQTLMFSATFADRILRLAGKMTKDAQRIALQGEHAANADITQTLHWTDGFEHKKKLLNHWLSDESVNQAVVFASTQQDTDMLAEELEALGHQVVALHGAMPQAVRNRRIRTLREGRARVLVATDVAARGLDVPAISHVINFGLPMKNEDYVHRIGRTGRAGRSGQAITLATHRERSKIRSLEEYLNARLPVSVIAGLEPSPPPEGGARRAGGGGGRSYGGGAGAGRGRPAGGSSYRGGEGRSEGGYRGRSEGSSDRPAYRSEGSSERPAYRSEGSSERPAYRSDSAPAGNREGRSEGGYRGRSEGSSDRPAYRDRDSSSAAPRSYNRDAASAAPRTGERDGNRGDYGNRSAGSDRPAYRDRDSSSAAPRSYNRDGASAAPRTGERDGNREGGYRARTEGSSSERPVYRDREASAAAAPRADRPRRDYQSGNRDDRFERQNRTERTDAAPRRKRED
jgi:superfamily II DNA/RNA helicase